VDTSKFKVGDTVVIEYKTENTNAFTLNDFKPSIGTHAKILEIDTVNKIIYTDYYTELDFQNLPPVAGSGFMYKTTPIKGIVIKNGVLRSITPNSAGKRDCAIRIEHAEGVTFENIDVVDFNDKAIQIRWMRNINVRNVNSEVMLGDKSLDYVVQCLDTYRGIFENITGTSNLAALDFSFGCSYITAKNIHSRNSEGAWGAIQLHGECEHDITFENCSGIFSFANNTGEFMGYSYNITLNGCKGAAYITGCDHLQVNNSNLILTSTDFSNLRIYGVEVNNSKIKLAKGVLYKAARLGGRIKPYLKFFNSEVKPFFEGATGLYKYIFIGFEKVSFVECNIKNTLANIGAYFVLDACVNFNFHGNVNEGFLFAIRNNDGGTPSPFVFNRYSFKRNEFVINDVNNAAKSYTTTLDFLFNFSNISDLTGLITFDNNEFYFAKSHARQWKFIELSTISTTSNLKFEFFNTKIDSVTTGEVDLTIPHNTGYVVEYGSNRVDISKVNEYGTAYRLSDLYPTSPTTGTWKVGKQIKYSQPTAGGKIGMVNVSTGVWKPFGTIDN
ncbi:hypothetical protein P4597_26660, partial [Peribacillus simplex]|uniref:hypothetical protein n=1 Tax=Peribacillus simplex TaxID=1478 RepID=UPI002E220740|nr:hypothetical protein [Peribacillus simplex]